MAAIIQQGRRDFLRMAAGTGALAAFGQLGLTASLAQSTPTYRAMVGIFLSGGNDGWNMVVPTDSRYSAYAASRGSTLALPQASLVPLNGSAMGLHPTMSALQSVWDAGQLGVVLNTGTLYQPLTKSLYQTRSDLRPLNLMSHSDEQAHWQGMRARGANFDGFMGRMTDRMNSTTALPPMVSIAGSQLAVLGAQTSALVLPSSGTLSRSGYSATSTNNAVKARQAALDAFADAAGLGTVTETTARGLSSAYGQITTANAILTATSTVDAFFVNPTTGAALTSDVSRQLNRIARMIEARNSLGHNRQIFFAQQGGFDNHADEVNGTNITGTHANLMADLAMAMAAFQKAMVSLGVDGQVTAFTMSDFGRTFKVNAQRGTDHAWGSNHLVMGGGLKAKQIHGAYPDVTLGGSADVSSEGRFIPGVSQEEYIGAIAQWHGVSNADMPYVFPNWSTWTSPGRGPLGLFA